MSTLNFSNKTELLISPEAYYAVAIVLFLIGFFGFCLNLCVIIFMWKNKQLWTPINIIIFNLVVSDFLVSVLGNPWTFYSAINRGWSFGKLGCLLYAFVMSISGISSISTLTLLAVERYLMVARPFRNNALNFRRAYCSVLIIWLYSLTLTSPPLFGWGEFVEEAAGISCSVNWEKKGKNSTSYILYLFAFGFFIPLLIIIFSYVNIISTMRQKVAKMGQVAKAEGKVAYIIFLMIIAFLLAWSPYAILALLLQFGEVSFLTPGMAVIPALLAKSSICYNPLIYIGLNSQQSWKQEWRKRTCSTSEDFLSIAPLNTQITLNLQSQRLSENQHNPKYDRDNIATNQKLVICEDIETTTVV